VITGCARRCCWNRGSPRASGRSRPTRQPRTEVFHTKEGGPRRFPRPGANPRSTPPQGLRVEEATSCDGPEPWCSPRTPGCRPGDRTVQRDMLERHSPGPPPTPALTSTGVWRWGRGPSPAATVRVQHDRDEGMRLAQRVNGVSRTCKAKVRREGKRFAACGPGSTTAKVADRLSIPNGVHAHLGRQGGPRTWTSGPPEKLGRGRSSLPGKGSWERVSAYRNGRTCGRFRRSAERTVVRAGPGARRGLV